MEKNTNELPSLKERENAYIVLKDYFENAFYDRERYYEKNKKETINSNVIEKLTRGYKIDLKECTYRCGYDFSLKSICSEEKLYLYKELENLVLTNEEKEQFYKMLRWYVMNIPYTEWSSINIESAFMSDIAIRYYLNEKRKRNPYKYLGKYIIMFEEARVHESPNFYNTRFAFSNEEFYSMYDHFEYEKYKSNYFLSYDKNGIDCEYSTPRFYFEDMALDFLNGNLIVNNKERYYDLIDKKYIEKEVFPIPLTSMLENFKYKNILFNIPIKNMEQIKYILEFINKHQKYNMDEVINLCETTYDIFSKIIWYSYSDEQTIDIDKIKNELIMNLIIDYVINDGNFYYGFNYDDRRNTKPKKFRFNSSIYFIGNVGELLFNDGKVSYKPFFDEKKDLCHLDSGNIIIDYKEKTKKLED